MPMVNKLVHLQRLMRDSNPKSYITLSWSHNKLINSYLLFYKIMVTNFPLTTDED